MFDVHFSSSFISCFAKLSSIYSHRSYNRTIHRNERCCIKWNHANTENAKLKRKRRREEL
ncbi:hypothetical protein ETC01_08700 [Geobacillus sp. NFOSA3]|nr:hypothetical protein [Geobacillus sp. NFOSA3]